MTSGAKLLLGGLAAAGVVGGFVMVTTRKSGAATALPPAPAPPPATDAMISTQDQPEWKEGYAKGVASKDLTVDQAAADAQNPYHWSALQRTAWNDGFWSGRTGTPYFHAKTDSSWKASSVEVISGALRRHVSGATSPSAVRSAIDNLDDDAVALEQELYKWSVDTYGPAGVKGAKPASNNTVGVEQQLYNGWSAWQTKWGDFREKVRDAMKVEGSWGGTAVLEDYTDGWARDVAKFRLEFEGWKKKSSEVIAAHGNVAKKSALEKSMPGAPSGPFPWGTMALVTTAVGVVGGIWWFGRKQAALTKKRGA